MQRTKVTLKQLPKTSVIVVTQEGGSRLFIANNDNLIISKIGFVNLLKSLIENNLIDERTIKGMLEELHTQ